MKKIATQALSELGRSLPDTFELRFDQTILEIREIKRILPKKRFAALAYWQNKRVFVKCFYGKQFNKYVQREQIGIQNLVNANLPSPTLLATLTDSQNACILIFQYIKTTQTFSTQDSPTLNILKKSVELIAKMHVKNLLQTDIHLDNFLIKQDLIYIIDAGLIKKYKKNLTVKQRGDNLSLFLMEFSPFLNLFLDILLPIYNQYFEQPLTIAEIKKTIFKQRKKRERHYIYKKVMRNCSAIKVRKTWRRYIAIKRDQDQPEIEQLCQNPDDYLEQSKIIKSGHSATVGLLEISGKRYLLKRYNRKNWVHFIIRSLIASRAAVSWRNGFLLRSYHIETPMPIALIEQRWGFLRGRSWLLLEYIEGQTLMNYFEKFPKKAEHPFFLDQLAQFVDTLATIRVSHGDLKAPNLLLTTDNKLYFIDLDAMTSHNQLKTFNPAFLKDLKRLERDIMGQVNTDFLFKLLN